MIWKNHLDETIESKEEKYIDLFTSSTFIKTDSFETTTLAASTVIPTIIASKSHKNHVYK